MKTKTIQKSSQKLSQSRGAVKLKEKLKENLSDTAPERTEQEQETIRSAMRLMGKSRSPKKLAAIALNRKLPRNRVFKPLSQFACTCGLGDNLKEQHPTTCARGLAIRRRQAKGAPLEL